MIKQIFRNNKNYKAIILLDRDGTINKKAGYLNRVGQLKLLPTVIDGLRLINNNNIAAIVITNQPVVAHGMLSIESLKIINETLVSLLEKEHAYIDAVYSCPHHPQGTVKMFSITCQCRKPNTLLYKQALKDYKIQKVLGIIGDSTRDIQLGKNLGIPTVTVHTGSKGQDGIHQVKSDFTCDNFLTSVKKLIELL